MAMDRSTVGVVIGLETHKLARGTVVRVATAAALVLVMATTVGGYAAAMHAGDTDLGRKAASMVTSPGWDGYTALGATSVSVTMLLAVGVVMSWSTGREFIDGTVVGLFAIPSRLGIIAAAKMAVVLTWATILGAVEAGALTTAGVLHDTDARCRSAGRKRAAGHVGGDAVARLPGRYRAHAGDPRRRQSCRRVRARFLRPVVRPDRVGLAPDGGQHAVAGDTGDDRRDRRLGHPPILGPAPAGRRLTAIPLEQLL